MAVVPERTCDGEVSEVSWPSMKRLEVLTRLVCRGEVVQERVSCRDRTLVDEGGAVGPVGALLEETVPVLRGRTHGRVRSRQPSTSESAYNGGRLQHRRISEIVDHVKLEVVALGKKDA